MARHKIHVGGVLLCSILILILSGSVVGAEELKIINVWDQWTDPVQDEAMNKVVNMFQEKHPDVRIMRMAGAMQDLQKVLKTAMSAGTGPDIFYDDAGCGVLGLYVDAGFVLDITDEFFARGLDKKVIPWAAHTTTFNDRIWGISHETETWYVYYNKEIFSQLGLNVPNTWNEFKKICAKTKEAGYIPCGYGLRWKLLAPQMFYCMASTSAGIEKMDEIAYGDGRWDDPAILRALKEFKELYDAGYLAPNALGVDYLEGNTLFWQGAAAMNPDGSWMMFDTEQQAKETGLKFDIFELPPLSDKRVGLPLNVGSAYAINADTKYPKAAMDFVEFVTTSDDVMPIFLSDELRTICPVDIDPSEYEVSPIFQKTLRMIMGTKHLPRIVQSAVWNTILPARWTDAVETGVQAVCVGTKTPEEVLAEVQKAWEVAKAKDIMPNPTSLYEW